MLRSPNSTFAVVVVVVGTVESYPRAWREAPVVRALRKCVVKLLKRCEFERTIRTSTFSMALCTAS